MYLFSTGTIYPHEKLITLPFLEAATIKTTMGISAAAKDLYLTNKALREGQG